MTLLASMLLAQLLAPTEVIEVWSLGLPAPRAPETVSLPLRERVVVRARYDGAPGAWVALPFALSAQRTPSVFLLGRAAPLTLRREGRGWAARLPDALPTVVRVVGVTEGPVPGLRGFRVAWPRVSPSATPTRRVAELPAAWLDAAPTDWSCPDTPAATVQCVSLRRAPAPLITRIAPVPGAPLAWALFAALAACVAAALAAMTRRAPIARATAAGGATVGAALALSWVGAGLCTWPVALAFTLLPGALVGASLPRHPLTRLGATGLLALWPLAAVSGVAPLWLTALTLAAGVTLFAPPMLTVSTSRGRP
ncbi:MAG: hypothetical protein JNK72_09200 [Myxococcales bacterium]|nr:hypothetical protein [Myxococcales bacterium]